MGTKYDWLHMKADYVQGVTVDGKFSYLTVLELAEKYNASYRYLQKKVTNWNWLDERKIFEKQAEEAKNRERIELLTKSSLEFNVASLDVAKMGIAFVSNALAKHGQAIRNNDASNMLTNNELESLARSATAYQRLGRVAMGEPESGSVVTMNVRNGDVSPEQLGQSLALYRPVIDEFVNRELARQGAAGKGTVRQDVQADPQPIRP